MKTAFFATVMLVAAFYGLTVVILPPIFIFYLSIPMIVLAAMVLWALPDRRSVSDKSRLEALLLVFTGLVVTWPDYVAIDIPGFAWISFRRLAAFAFAFAFLMMLSTSSVLRGQLRQAYGLYKPFWLLLLGFFGIQWLTLPLSASPFQSFNQVFNQMFVWAIPAVASVLLMTFRDGYLTKWIRVVVAAAAFNCVISLLEFYNGRLLWADHIPSFLTVQDEVLYKILGGTMRDGRYRVTSVYTVSLCLAEFLAFATPFVLHRILSTGRIFAIAAWVSFDLVLLLSINLTQSRLGIVGWLAAHFVLVVLWGLKFWQRHPRSVVGPTIGIFAPMAALAFTISMFTVPAVNVRTIGGGSTSLSDQSREQQYALFWPKVLSNPIGYGAARSGVTLGWTNMAGELSVDSYIITVALDYGVLGLILFVGLLFYSAYLALKVYYKEDTEPDDPALALAVSVMVLALIRLVLSQYENLPLLYMAVAGCFAVAARPLLSPPVATERDR